MKGSTFAAIEPLESRTLFSGGPSPHVYEPDAVVRGHSISQWVANWWTQVWQTPVHGPNGTDLNPMLFDDAPSAQGDAGRVFYLYSTFVGGNHTHAATVPSGTPLFVPVLPIVFSNFDTATGNASVPPATLPGNSTAAQLSEFAAQAALPALGPGGSLHLSVDGKSLPNVGAFREIAPTFSYVLPQDNADQFIFGQSNLVGLDSPAEADGYYVILKPLSVGTHVIDFGGVTPGGSLGPLNVDITYTVKVVPKGVFNESLAMVNAAAELRSHASHAGSSSDDQDDWVSAVLK